MNSLTELDENGIKSVVVSSHGNSNSTCCRKLSVWHCCLQIPDSQLGCEERAKFVSEV